MDVSQKDFEAQKKMLMDRITVSVDQLNLTMETFNRNLETANRLGKQFKPPAEVWAAFHKSVQSKSGIEPDAFGATTGPKVPLCYLVIAVDQYSRPGSAACLTPSAYHHNLKASL
ncbi:hypothetical protein EDC96DRAFT_566508 [Choanephora cucurbitarum]|nr:hypothetical protein EDC96DRAFT_566508 [Choanephora cucurbitarum]